MATWTRELQEIREMEGSLEEALRAFPYIEGDTRDWGLDVWLKEAGHIEQNQSAAEASDEAILTWATSHRSQHGGSGKSPRREFVELSHGLTLTHEEEAVLVAHIRHWLAIRR